MLEIIIKKISENDALKLYNSLVKPEVAALKKASSRGKNKRNKTLNILNNIESSFFVLKVFICTIAMTTLSQKQKKV